MNRVHKFGLQFGDKMIAGLNRSQAISTGKQHWHDLSKQYTSKGRDFSKDILYGTFAASWGLTFTAVIISKSRLGLWGITLLSLSSGGIYFTLLRKPLSINHAESHNVIASKRVSTSQTRVSIPKIDIPLLDSSDSLVSEKPVENLDDSPVGKTVLNLTHIKLGTLPNEIWIKCMIKFLNNKLLDKRVSKDALRKVVEIYLHYHPENITVYHGDRLSKLTLNSQLVKQYEQHIGKHLEELFKIVSEDGDTKKCETSIQFLFTTFASSQKQEKLYLASEIIQFLDKAKETVEELNLGEITSPQVLIHLSERLNIRRMCLQMEGIDEYLFTKPSKSQIASIGQTISDISEIFKSSQLTSKLSIENDKEFIAKYLDFIEFNISLKGIREFYVTINSPQQLTLQQAQFFSDSNLEKLGLKGFEIDQACKGRLIEKFENSSNPQLYVRKNIERKGQN